MDSSFKIWYIDNGLIRGEDSKAFFIFYEENGLKTYWTGCFPDYNDPDSKGYFNFPDKFTFAKNYLNYNWDRKLVKERILVWALDLWQFKFLGSYKGW